MKKLYAAAFILALTFLPVRAQIKNAYTGRKTRMLFLLDGSGSMVAQMDKTNRWSIAVTLMNKMVDTLRGVENLEIALRVFGHNVPITKKDCHDTKLEVPFAPNNHKNFKTKLMQVKPLGYTSITNSLLAAAKDFPLDKTARNIIVIITDGVEECGGDPCAVSEELQKKGIILKPFIVGIGSGDEIFRKTFGCAGRFYNAETESEFSKVIGVIINQALNNTSAQINLLDAQGMPRETDVPITIYDAYSGRVVDNIIHTMNGKGLPDTLFLDPVLKFNIVVHTIPQIVKNDVEIIPGRHNVIGIDAAQGNLLLKIGGITKYGRLPALLRKSGDMNTLATQEFNTNERYLTGTYDLEILTLPRTYLKGISIKQSQTTTIELAAPGTLQVTMAREVIAGIFAMQDNQMVWVCDLQGQGAKETFTMQPGDYKLVYRMKGETRTLYSKTKEFKVTSGSGTFLIL